jgi:hypothetical protein
MARFARSALLRSRAHLGDIPSLSASSSIVTPAASFSRNLKSRFAISHFVARRRLGPAFVGSFSRYWVIPNPFDILD